MGQALCCLALKLTPDIDCKTILDSTQHDQLRQHCVHSFGNHLLAPDSLTRLEYSPNC